MDPVGFLASQKTPEDKNKVRSVDFYELDVVKNEPDATSNVRCEVTEDEDGKDVEDKKDVDSAQNKESFNYFDRAQPSSLKLFSKKCNQTCLCKECVENYSNVREDTEEQLIDKEKKEKAVNVRENTEEPLVDEEKAVNVRENTEEQLVDEEKAVNVREDTEEQLVDEEKKEKAVNVREDTEEQLVDEEKKEKAVNVREDTEEPLVDEEKAVNVRENIEEPLVDEGKKDEAAPGIDNASVRSRSVSETSRHTDSSENDFIGTRCEDAQVTLPYPDKNGPPECIARLSNAGLYDPSEEPTGKTGDEDKISQVAINTAFFVEHPALEEQKHVRMEYDKVDIEKGDPESEPLMRLTRRSVEKEPVYPGFCGCHKACLKLVGSFVLSMVIFPAFLFGAYAWLPFDAPVIPDVPTRLVYTLRCSAFASFPIVLGVIIHGISRLCASSYDPFKPREREVTIHRRFVKQSTFLFVLFFFNLSVLATYLPQKHLKFIPLFTCLFSLSQLIYWLSFAVGRSFRGFGYGLTFLPLLSMLICNLYFMFVIEPEKMIFLGSRVAPQH